MMNKIRSLLDRSNQQGQALVEAALFFPIFLVIIAGMVEVSQLVVTQNRVTDAARASARFAANGGENEGIVTTALNTIDGSLDADAEFWDIWIIRAKINAAGDAFEEWEFTHAYGYTNTVKSATISESDIQAQVLAELQKDHNGNSSIVIAGDLEIVGTYLIHDVNAILGLDAVPALAELNSVTELSIMRIFGIEQEQTNGCSAFPIAVHEGIRSATPLGEGASPYPDASDFSYPDTPPTYESFIAHQPNIDLDNAQEGYIYKINNGFGSGNFGWLLWNQGRPSSANTLAESLTWPGDSVDYSDHGDNSISPAADGYPYIVRGYVEPGDATDTSLHLGDWVAGNTGSINANQVRTSLEAMVDSERAIRVIVWDEAEEQGSNGRYRVTGFAIFRLVGYRLSQGQGGSWILGEFIRWDASCGQIN